MKIIIAHKSPDLDSISSMWLLRRFLPGWEHSKLDFVPAGDRLPQSASPDSLGDNPIEVIGEDEVIHVDTGLGPLDHHQTESQDVCAAKLTFDYVLSQKNNSLGQNHHKMEAVRRIVDFAVDVDHFQEVYFSDPTNDIYDFTFVSVIDGYQMMHPREDANSVEFGFTLLDTVLHTMEKKIWAEDEIKEKGIEFGTPWGKGLAVETENDMVLKLAQKRGYTIVLRKDPHSGNTRIKALPDKRTKKDAEGIKREIDLTPIYEKVKKMDPDASWFLHVSKRMLLNGSSKNPNMRGSKLTLRELVDVLQNGS